MPEGLTITDREQDPYAWALAEAAAIRRGDDLAALERQALGEFLEEWADEIFSAVRSHMVNLMLHAAKSAASRNPQVVGHWRSECVEFHDRIIDGYRPSMRDKIDIESLWRRARRKAFASFDDHGEPRPQLPTQCPFKLQDLVDPDLDIDRLVAGLRAQGC